MKYLNDVLGRFETANFINVVLSDEAPFMILMHSVWVLPVLPVGCGTWRVGPIRTILPSCTTSSSLSAIHLIV